MRKNCLSHTERYETWSLLLGGFTIISSSSACSTLKIELTLTGTKMTLFYQSVGADSPIF